MMYSVDCVVFFFFKQKTAYEMRISDWSSDVCSSDLTGCKPVGFGLRRFESYPLHHPLRTDGADVGRRASDGRGNRRGCSSMVEHQPSKLATWVRFPSPADRKSVV